MRYNTQPLKVHPPVSMGSDSLIESGNWDLIALLKAAVDDWVAGIEQKHG